MIIYIRLKFSKETGELHTPTLLTRMNHITMDFKERQTNWQCVTIAFQEKMNTLVGQKQGKIELQISVRRSHLFPTT